MIYFEAIIISSKNYVCGSMVYIYIALHRCLTTKVSDQDHGPHTFENSRLPPSLPPPPTHTHTYTFLGPYMYVSSYSTDSETLFTYTCNNDTHEYYKEALEVYATIIIMNACWKALKCW